MARLARRKDGNQSAIEKALTEAGVFWFDTSRTGFGFPDMVVIHAGVTLLVEVKQPGERLTPKELEFYTQCINAGGKEVIAYSAQDVLEALDCP